MNLLLIEDEASVARRLERLLRKILGDQISSLHVGSSVDAARDYLQDHPVDLLFLDLNLNGEDGFTVLQHLLAEACDVIVVSAYGDRALEAFDHGVLDFVPKPFREERLRRAVQRYLDGQPSADHPLKKLAVKRRGRVVLVDVNDIIMIQGADIYSTLHLKSENENAKQGATELTEKTLESLERLLPSNFSRVHKSYIVDMNACQEILVEGGGRYQLLLADGRTVPLGRTRYQAIKAQFFS
ncbi:MAG: LytR/AlgR family response regulator transcription factor [Saprospiraceae bacterium]